MELLFYLQADTVCFTLYTYGWAILENVQIHLEGKLLCVEVKPPGINIS